MSSAGGSHLVYEFDYDCCSCGVCRVFAILSIPAVGKKMKTSAPGVGILSILLEAVNIIPLSIFHIMCIFICLFR